MTLLVNVGSKQMGAAKNREGFLFSLKYVQEEDNSEFGGLLYLDNDGKFC